MMRRRLAQRTELFPSCVTRESSLEAAAFGATNLAQGFPESDPPEDVVQAAMAAMAMGGNQYSDMRGLEALRVAVVEHRRRWWDAYPYDPEQEVTVTCGATEGMAAALLALVDPGDEVLIQQPAYENYGPQVMLAGGVPRYYRLAGAGARLELDALEALVSARTRAIVFNTPNNPTGRVFVVEELKLLAELCSRHDLILISDEVYEHLTWDGRRHVSPATVNGLRDRTVIVSSLSKAWAATGWRVGWVVAPAAITAAVRRVHDFLTACASTPAQYGAVVALGQEREYYTRLREGYEARRGLLAGYLAEAGVEFALPEGGYYFWVNGAALGYPDSDRLARELRQHAQVGIVPWQAFFQGERPADRAWARINFAKEAETIRRAGERVVECLKRRSRIE